MSVWKKICLNLCTHTVFPVLILDVNDAACMTHTCITPVIRWVRRKRRRICFLSSPSSCTLHLLFVCQVASLPSHQFAFLLQQHLVIITLTSLRTIFWIGNRRRGKSLERDLLFKANYPETKQSKSGRSSMLWGNGKVRSRITCAYEFIFMLPKTHRETRERRCECLVTREGSPGWCK